jgi:hypothetical protein
MRDRALRQDRWKRGRGGIAVLLLAAMLAAAGAAWSAPQTAFRFAVIGDTRNPWVTDARPDPFGDSPAFLQTIGELNLLDYDLVVNVGDLIVGYTEDAREIAGMWDHFDRTRRRFTMPAKIVAGNHDIWDLPSYAIYVSRYGDPTYSFDMSGCHFIVLDSEDPPGVDTGGKILGRQLDWLQRDLETHKDAAHTFVFLHRPLWDYDAKDSNWKADVHPLLAKYHVTAVFAGHRHQFRDFGARDGVHYFISGGGGAEIGGNPPQGDFLHHMSVTVRGDEVHYAVVHTGNVWPIETVSERSAAAISALGTGLKGLTAALRMGTPARVEFTARNERSAPLDGALVWKVPENWRVEPRGVELDLQPGELAKVVFAVTPLDAELTALPECTAIARWGAGPTFTQTAPLGFSNDWFVREWMVIGPFDLGPPDPNDPHAVPPGFDKAFPPETGVDLSAHYPGLGGAVGWKPMTARQDGYVDLLAVKPSDRAVAYAAATVTARRATKTLLTLGSNDGAKVWVNGQQVYAKHAGRSARPNEDTIPIALREGPNQVLLKVENLGGVWGFYAAVVDLGGVLEAAPPRS